VLLETYVKLWAAELPALVFASLIPAVIGVAVDFAKPFPMLP
jgi:hypothetical protein